MAALTESWRIDLSAVRDYRNAILCLWGLAVVVVAAFYLVTPFAGLLESIGRWQRETGWPAAFAICAVFCGLIPYSIYAYAGCRNAPRHPLRIAVAQALWCGSWGVICSWLYQWQAQMFGSGHEVATVLKKTCFDQFVWTVLVAVPANAVFYAALAGKLRFGKPDGRSVRDYIVRAYLPNLIMNWCIGIPSNLAVYSFPCALQIVALGLISSGSAVICVGIGSRFR